MTRSRTPPEVKWAANELAAVMGELARLDEHLSELALRRQELLKVRDSLELAGRVLCATAVMEHMPEVRPHRGRRGRLLPFLRSAVEQAAPASLNTSTLARMARDGLGFTLETEKAWAQFRDNNVSRAMRKLVSLGLVERVNDVAAARVSGGEWRWKSGPSAQDLMAASREHG